MAICGGSSDERGGDSFFCVSPFYISCGLKLTTTHKFPSSFFFPSSPSSQIFYLLSLFFRIARIEVPMAKNKLLGFLLLVFFCTVLLSVIVIPGCRAHRRMLRHSLLAEREQWLQWKFKGEDGNSRRLMIGSTRPTCTYNECRSCRFRCTAEQVPVEGNDPIHSAYHYKCVCHLW